jgi:hypothetical protein
MIRIPVLGWTFADDFFTSKTTHLAVAVAGTAVAGYRSGALTIEQALIFVAGSFTVAFLRDAHSKGLNYIGDVLFNELHQFGYQIPTEADGGEVPTGPVTPPVPPVLQPTLSVSAPANFSAADVAAEVAKILKLSVPNPAEAAISGSSTAEVPKP